MKTLDEILKTDVYDEEFIIPFTTMLEKFVDEYDDMQYMEVIRLASKLLKAINE